MTAIFSGLVLIFAVIAASLAKQTLLNVIQVYRHGERTPGSFYTNDPYQDISYWGLSEGQLTNVGKRQHYELGQYTRRRYAGFLPQRYSRETFLVQSTRMDRTIMSAASQLSGLFPPRGDQVWNKDIFWQPIPIFQTEIAVMSPLDTCARFWPELSTVLGSDEYFVNLDEQNKELYKYLTIHTGDNITSLFGAYSVYDTLYIEDRQGFVLPRWTKRVYPEPLKTLNNIVFDAFSFSDELKLLTAGPFLTAVIEQFDGYLADPSSARKYVQYSAHDLNVAAILNTLGAFKPILAPNFASTIYIEFWDKNGTNYINIYYKNYGGPEPITVAGCNFDCKWDDFKSIVSNRTLTSGEWYALCDT